MILLSIQIIGRGEIVGYWNHTENTTSFFTYFCATEQVVAFLIRKQIFDKERFFRILKYLYVNKDNLMAI